MTQKIRNGKRNLIPCNAASIHCCGGQQEARRLCFLLIFHQAAVGDAVACLANACAVVEIHGLINAVPRQILQGKIHLAGIPFYSGRFHFQTDSVVLAAQIDRFKKLCQTGRHLVKHGIEARILGSQHTDRYREYQQAGQSGSQHCGRPNASFFLSRFHCLQDLCF